LPKEFAVREASRSARTPAGALSNHPSSVSMALNPRAPSARMTLDLPVPDIPVSSTRFTAAILCAPRCARAATVNAAQIS